MSAAEYVFNEECQAESDPFDNDTTGSQPLIECLAPRKCAKEWIFVGSTVLARWSNGLWYLGLIVEVDLLSSHCLVQFEDDSLHWIRFEDLHKQLSVNSVMADSDILCAVCHDGISLAPNEIVICDVCNQGYHQECHKPRISDDILQPDVPWSCRLCVFALGTREGGAEKNGIIGKSLKQMKMELPYDMNSLTWDSLHQVNQEEKYCYCGGQGEYYKKMLQCEKCLQWFHEACIQVLETPLLYGDHYYTFVCAICNCGKEMAKRIIMKWSDVVALILNNLALQHDRKFFDLHEDIIPFFQNNCHMLKLSEDVSKLHQQEIAEKITLILCNNKKRFVSGKERKKKSTVWSLRGSPPMIFAPPFALSNSPKKLTPPHASPDSGLPSSASSSSNLSSPSKSGAPLMYGACRKGASKWPSPRKVSNKKQSSASISKKKCNRRINTSSSVSSNRSSASKNSAKLTVDLNNKTGIKRLTKTTKKVNQPKKARARAFCLPPSSTSDISDFETSSRSTCTIESLDSVIPVPKSFDGDNNPFMDNDSSLFRNCLALASKRRKNNDDDPSQDNFASKTSSLELIDTTKYLDQEENFNVLARRIKSDGTVEYLVEWDNQ